MKILHSYVVRYLIPPFRHFVPTVRGSVVYRLPLSGYQSFYERL